MKLQIVLKILGIAALVVAGVAAVLAVLAGIIALEGLIIWVLWNALVPSLAGGPSVTYVQGVLIGVALNIVGAVIGNSAR